MFEGVSGLGGFRFQAKCVEHDRLQFQGTEVKAARVGLNGTCWDLDHDARFLALVARLLPVACQKATRLPE
jgi:hypothetical protein